MFSEQNIVAGAYDACAIVTGTGGLRCWGLNSAGEAGIGSTAQVSTVPAADIAVNVSRVTVGTYFTCALMKHTTGVRCWGACASGALGNAQTGGNVLSVPSTDVITGVLDVKAGGVHVCVLLASAFAVRCWGNGAAYQLGSGSTADITSPPATDVLTGVSQLALGTSHTCVVMRGSGGVRCFGDNRNGQCGAGNTQFVTSPPTTDAIVGVSAISSGSKHVCVILYANSGLRCWGENRVSGQAGAPIADGDVLVIPTTDLLTGVTHVAAGLSHTCVILQAISAVRCWGDNTQGKIGNGLGDNLPVPFTASTIIALGYVQITAGYAFTCGVFGSSGGVRCWGNNGYANITGLMTC